MSLDPEPPRLIQTETSAPSGAAARCVSTSIALFPPFEMIVCELRFVAAQPQKPGLPLESHSVLPMSPLGHVQSTVAPGRARAGARPRVLPRPRRPLAVGDTRMMVSVATASGIAGDDDGDTDEASRTSPSFIGDLLCRDGAPVSRSSKPHGCNMSYLVTPSPTRARKMPA